MMWKCGFNQCDLYHNTHVAAKTIMSSFFLPSKSKSRDKKAKKQQKLKKKQDGKTSATGAKRKRRPETFNEEIESDSEVEGDDVRKGLTALSSEDEYDVETAPEKRLRLAKEYLSNLQEEERAKTDDADFDQDAIAHRLRDDMLEQAGRLQRKVADKYIAPDPGDIRKLRGHRLPVTCVVATPDDKYVYSGAKDCCIIKWLVETGVKEVIFSGHRKGVEGVVGHTGHVLALAVSSDGKFLASGGQDRVVHVWDVKTNSHVHTFTGHRDTVSGLSFQRGTHELFSCSFDRTLKVWNLDEMAYVETLFGHQDSVSSIDCMLRERPISAGMNDRSVRIWKVAEESQLVFHGHKSYIDAVRYVNDEYFISGSQDGVALWNVMKKKPMATRPHTAHKGHTEHWVTAVAAYTNTDLVASGSNDGQVCVWKCGEGFRSLEPCFSIPLNGFVNSLMFSHGGTFLVAAIGQEHRLGRWWTDKSVKNTIAIIPLKHSV
ncbi:U3 small nucleolar RNA-interacting protein 2-like isoform X2 [Halichondria panicea]|uniref:U3 small nucleolar RNA-interacting protein 2-like isoform X2 n=1 Tax=Halichondria panicea TaxID=6063 RepID=UPI00312B8673